MVSLFSDLLKDIFNRRYIYNYCPMHFFQLMQTQKADSQRMLIEVRNTAEAHISDQSQQLQTLSQTLTRERLQANSVREEHKEMAEQFQIENTNLRAQLQMVSWQLQIGF